MQQDFTVMAQQKKKDERWALSLLEQIVRRSNEDGDALPGQVVKRVKQARTILKRRLRGTKRPQGRAARE